MPTNMDIGASFLFLMDSFKELAGFLSHLLTEFSSLLHGQF